MATETTERQGMTADELTVWGQEFLEKLAATDRILAGFEALAREIMARREQQS